MTTKKDLKRLVRARMAETGEPYTRALAEVRARAPVAAGRPSLIDELRDVSALARRAGLSCAAEVSERRWAELGESFVASAFARLTALAAVLDEHPGVARMRRALKDGVAPPPSPIMTSLAFLEQVRAGFRGISSSGDLAAIDVDDARARPRLVLFMVRHRGDSAPDVLLQIDPRIDAVGSLLLPRSSQK